MSLGLEVSRWLARVRFRALSVTGWRLQALPLTLVHPAGLGDLRDPGILSPPPDPADRATHPYPTDPKTAATA